MSCEHAEGATLLWLYGEGDAAQAAHVAECAECSEVVAMHADVAVAAAGLETQALPAPANSRAWMWLPAVVAAAALAFALIPGASVAPVDTGARVAVAPAAVVPVDDLSFELDGLDAELDELSLDLSTL
ncbi:MAG: hypothetical protein KC912_05515 [Proteobacteria bacterium]|nr:hypothetical protein [Pseudomonadota bacterium]